jgi:hypothetical protein
LAGDHAGSVAVVVVEKAVEYLLDFFLQRVGIGPALVTDQAHGHGSSRVAVAGKKRSRRLPLPAI